MAIPVIISVLNIETALPSGLVGEGVRILGSYLTQPNMIFDTNIDAESEIQDSETFDILYDTDGYA